MGKKKSSLKRELESQPRRTSLTYLSGAARLCHHFGGVEEASGGARSRRIPAQQYEGESAATGRSRYAIHWSL